MRHLYGHPDVARELGVGCERALPVHTTRPRRRPRLANGLPPRPMREPTDER
jgi:IS5 family transposase